MTTGRRAGVSLIETLVVIGLLGLLLGLLLPAVQNVRAAASRMTCLSNMRQIGLALQNYESNYRSLPPEMVEFPPSGGKGFGAALSWRVPLLPYLEQETLWAKALQAVRLDPYSYHNPPHEVFQMVLRTYICPNDGRLLQPLSDPNSQITGAYTSYLGISGRGPGPNGFAEKPHYRGVFSAYPNGTRVADIRDGTSNTLAVGERPPPTLLGTGWWYSAQCDPTQPGGPCRGPATSMLVDMPEPIVFDGCSGPFYFGPGRLDNPCDRFHFWSLHSGGANFLFADASARFLRYDAQAILPALATRAGGENVVLPD